MVRLITIENKCFVITFIDMANRSIYYRFIFNSIINILPYVYYSYRTSTVLQPYCRLVAIQNGVLGWRVESDS